MTKNEFEKLQFFKMTLVNLKDDFILGRRTQIDAEARRLGEAWQDLTDKQKKEVKTGTHKMLKLFIEHLPSVGGNKFLEDYARAFKEEVSIPKPQQFAAMRIFKEMLTEIENQE